jgi:hypothetical protein
MNYERRAAMATDYDAPRKTDDDSESIDAIKERVPDKLASALDVDEADSIDAFSVQEVVNEELDVVVLPPQDDEFTCSECFIVKHHTMLSSKKGKYGKLCLECAEG